MIIIVKSGATEEQIGHIVDRIGEWGLKAEVSRGALRTVIGVIGPEDAIREKPIAAMPGVTQTIDSAFAVEPRAVDWLVCDVIAYPDRTLALLGSGDPSTFLARASDLAEVARSRGVQIELLRAADKRQADAQAVADTTAATAKAAADAVAAEQATIADSLTQQKALLVTLQERQAELVRQAQEAAAKAAAEQRAADEAAAQQAVEAAQQEKQRLDAQAAALAATPPPAATPPAPAAAAPAPPPSGTDNAPVDQAPVQVASSGAAGAVALAAARSQIGKPYVYGAAGPDSYDCSGLTMWAYARAGISLSHYTGAQYGEGRHVSRGELQPGDLVFFSSDLHHVGIYSGGGNMVDAPHTGAYVREEPLFGDYAGAVRPGG